MEMLCQVRGELMSIHSDDRLQLIDITPRIIARVRRCEVRDGLALLSSMHTTLALFVNECQDALLDDIRTFLEHVVAKDRYWKHNDPVYSDCDRRNADAHLRACLLGHSLTLPIVDGELALGTFQSIIAAELDGPRARALHVQVLVQDHATFFAMTCLRCSTYSHAK
jgi:secondary thiamine-phosphate synthase enzyme